MEMKTAVERLSALAQESRLSVIRLLIEAGAEGLNAGAISDELGIPAPTLSFHLKDLSHAGLVSSKRLGRAIIYNANYKSMNDLIDFMLHNCCKRSSAEDDCC